MAAFLVCQAVVSCKMRDSMLSECTAVAEVCNHFDHVCCRLVTFVVSNLVTSSKNSTVYSRYSFVLIFTMIKRKLQVMIFIA